MEISKINSTQSFKSLKIDKNVPKYISKAIQRNTEISNAAKKYNINAYIDTHLATICPMPVIIDYIPEVIKTLNFKITKPTDNFIKKLFFATKKSIEIEPYNIINKISKIKAEDLNP